MSCKPPSSCSARCSTKLQAVTGSYCPDCATFFRPGLDTSFNRRLQREAELQRPQMQNYLPSTAIRMVTAIAITAMTIAIAKNVLLDDDFAMAVSVLAIASFALPIPLTMAVSVLAIVAFTSPKPSIICSRVVCKLFSVSRSRSCSFFISSDSRSFSGPLDAANPTNGYYLSFFGWRITAAHLCPIHFLTFSHAEEITHPSCLFRNQSLLRFRLCHHRPYQELCICYRHRDCPLLPRQKLRKIPCLLFTRKLR